MAGGRGPASLPFLLLPTWAAWRFANMLYRHWRRIGLAWSAAASRYGTGAGPYVLYLRSFVLDRWSVRAEGFRYPPAKYRRPPFEEVVVSRLWRYGQSRPPRSRDGGRPSPARWGL